MHRAGRADSKHGVPHHSGYMVWRYAAVMVLAVAVAAFAVGCSADEEDAASEESGISVQEAALAGGWDAVSWTGDGRFAVLQTFDGDGMPTVIAWDSQSGDISEISGYVVISLEPASSQVWVEPKTAEHVATEMLEAPEYTYLDLGPFDEPSPHIEVWDPATGDAPSADVPAYYEPDDGGLEYVAHYGVDPDTGGLPSTLLLSAGETRDEGHEAELPQDLSTFSIIGWSPSGDFVAVEELTQKDVALAAASGLDGESVAFPQRRVLVIEAESGKVVDETAFSDDVIAPAQWLGDADVLVWAVDSIDTGEYALMALEVGGVTGEFTEVTGVDLPTEMMSGTPPYPLGSGTFGIMLVTWTPEGLAQMWRLDSVGAEPTGSFEMVDQIAWSQGGGVAILTYQLSEDGGEEYVTVGISDETGSPPELAITGPSRPGYGIVEE